MNLDKINSVAVLEDGKPVIRLSDLPLKTAIPIVSARLTSSKFGSSVLLELSDNRVFLPKRCTPLLEAHLDQFIPGAYNLIYLGEKIYKQHQTPIFNIVENE